MLEYNLIQEHRPRFNIRYRDDKSYPYLALTVGERWPRAQVLRGAKRKGVRYFGPYGHAWAIRDTLDALTRVFPVRTCSHVLLRPAGEGRPAVPVLRHRPVRRARASPPPRGSPTSPTASTWTRWRTSSAATRGRSCSGSTWRCGGVRAPGVRAGRPVPRSALRRPPCPRVAGDGAVPAARTSTWSAWPRTTSRRASRSSSSGEGACSVAGDGSSIASRSSIARS